MIIFLYLSMLKKDKEKRNTTIYFVNYVGGVALFNPHYATFFFFD